MQYAKPLRLGKKKEETTALLCYLKAKTFASTKRLGDTPCMKDVGSPHVVKNPPGCIHSAQKNRARTRPHATVQQIS